MAPRSVAITGSSTGIGRAAALWLDRHGWTVFAGVRKGSDADSLREEASDRLHTFMIDVADQASIEAAAKTIDEQTGGRLDGLVNNAGISVQGPLEYLPLDDLRRQFEVNVTGQVAVTQAFLPQIRAATGRIVFVGSVAGRAPTMPFLAPYGGSKKALEAVAEALRTELSPSGIRVSIIEPGSVDTVIWDKGDSTFDEMIESLPPEGRERYETALGRARKIGVAVGRRGISPDKVAAKIEHALASPRPRFRYLIGKDAAAQLVGGALTPPRVRDRTINKVLGFTRRR
jgi:NAD(P)-dependent dehydrogenase (short-subunit alcohol dehydrogenase family)